MHFMNQESKRRRVRAVAIHAGSAALSAISACLHACALPSGPVRARPARRDLGRRPGDDPVWIGQNNDVQVVRHHGIHQDFDGEGAGGLADEITDPVAAGQRHEMHTVPYGPMCKFAHGVAR